ncbi:capsule assembly Wzi family protein [Mucilaginibacter auburnensis]|uniref:Capsule assembly protein Wzi n=1 Tax=Mucilaginibacter auburnensis TaxID=1457233 RepID=A0A2H9VTE6_9SPHI|nr:capsule assembly Wzi family protein [Mucilaginibacter auburnensis]PJJ84062.1 capsule assembly protein Wzi [Mucilaginibacter auburnensis]
MKNAIFLTALFVSSLISAKLFSQTVPVGTPAIEDYYRRMQLVGKVDSNLSFSVRPLFAEALKVNDIFDPEGNLKTNWNKPDVATFAQGKGLFRVLPFTILQQFNSHHPYGWNDGTMIPAKGYQTQISGGIYFKYGPLSIQLRPDFVYAANPPFDGFESGHDIQDIARYYRLHSVIDYPERFGNTAYKKATLGASSIRLTFDPISIGVSNENLWWGPGISNALVLTNNAPGFQHISVNTVRPIRTGIGYFEGEIMAGILQNSGLTALSTPPQPSWVTSKPGQKDEKRYFTGYNINYHPKWVPGLTLGMTRTFSSYYSDNKRVGDFIPFLVPFQKRDANNGAGDAFPRDQITSLYVRWLFNKVNAEIYFEYGWEDNLYNIRDFVGSPEHSRAYILGLRKLFPINGHNGEYIMFDTEITQTSLQSAEAAIREVSYWYYNFDVKQGHTNFGQVLGAGTGPSGNIQSMSVSWMKGLKRLGFGIERYEHDVDYYRETFADINGNSRKWVDLAFSLQGEWNYKNLIFNARLKTIRSFNYQWILKNYTPDNYYIPNNTVYNLHAQLGVTYRF